MGKTTTIVLGGSAATLLVVFVLTYGGWDLLGLGRYQAGPPLKTVRAGPYTVEVYDNKDFFAARLRGQVHLVDFDDVNSISAQNVPFKADRYAERYGIVIQGEGGQFVDRTFRFPSHYPPASPPNMYAPGPIGSRPGPRGGFHTSVTFVQRGSPAAVAGFGAVFIDADFPALGPCSIALCDARGKLIAQEQRFSGPNASQLFRGLVVLGPSNRPIPVASKVEITNGCEWPAYNAAEGVPLDDFFFSRPVRMRVR